MKINLTYKLLTITLIVLAGNGLLGFAFYKINQTVLVSEHWVQHTDEVLNASASVLAMSRDMETASAGFVITQDRSFLDPLYTAQKTIFNSLLQLRKLTLDNPRQQKRIDSLEADLKNYLDYSLKTVEKRKKQARGPAMAFTSAIQSKVYTDHILQTILAIQQEEHRLLIKRTQTNIRDVENLHRITAVIFIMLAGLTILLIQFISKNIRQVREKVKWAAEIVMANKTLLFQNIEKETRAAELIIANEELSFQNGEKESRAAELVIANQELLFQNEEKGKRAAELIIANQELFFQNTEKEKRAAELAIANKELSFQNREKEKRAAELIIANEELFFQNTEKEKRAAELVIANEELSFQNIEKEKRAAELVIANKELSYQNIEKEKRAAELVIANEELSFQNAEKEKRAAELVIANEELSFQNLEKEKRAAELVIANEELSFQNAEKEKRAAELVVANKELSFQNLEKEKRAAELAIANDELSFQNGEKENRAAELFIANKELFFQNTEKGHRASELSIANEELSFQNSEKESRAAELVVANEELFFQNTEKEKRANELIIANLELSFQNQEREKRAAELKKANRLYAFISEINQNIVREKGESELFRNACCIAHDFGKFKIAWIGMFDADDNAITQIAQTGIPNEALGQFENVALKPGGPQSQVLLTGKYFICNDIANDAELRSWSALAVKQMINSCIILPIIKSAKIIGTFNLYAAELNFFNKEEIALLVEVTNDISFALDIFEREKVLLQTQNLVSENEKRFHSLIENSADMITLSKPAGEFIYGSSSLTHGLGYSMDDLIQLSVFDIIHPDDIPGAKHSRDLVLTTPGQSVYYQQRRKHKNGNWIWCEGSLTNMLDEPGIRALVSNFRDISEKKIAEMRREYDKNNMDALLNNSNDLMWSVDTDFRMITSNKPFDDYMEGNGRKKVKEGGNILKIAITSVESSTYKSFYERAFAGESFTEVVYDDLPSETWSEISFCPIRSADEVIGTACHSHDITERIIAAHQLNQSEIFNRGVLNSLSSHVAVLDKRGFIIAANQSWNRFFAENGQTILERTRVGSNYFEVCEKSAAAGEEIAAKALAGMKAVMAEEITVFNLEYPCHSRNSDCWFAMQVMKFETDDSMIVVSHQDISKRKIAEDNAVKSANSYLKTLNDLNKTMDASLDVICSINEEGRFVSLSEASYPIWGYKPEELIGRKFIDLVFPEDVEKSLATAAEVITGYPVRVFENRYVNKDGRVIPLLWSANWHANDQVMYCVAKDITEKKKLETAFESERLRFYDLFLEAPSCMGIFNGPDHVFEMANPLCLQLIGKTDIIGKPLRLALPEVVPQGFIKILNKVYKTGKTFSAEEMLIKLDSHNNGILVDTYLNITFQAYKSKESVFAGIFFFFIDVTEQVLSRRKIEENEIRYRQIVETAQEGIWLLDENDQTTFANDKMCGILEYTAEEMLGRTKLSFNDEEANPNGRQQSIITAKSANDTYDTQFMTKSGRRIWAHVSTNPIYNDGQYQGMLYMITDITGRKATEERLATSESRLTEAQDIARIGNFEIDMVDFSEQWSDQMYKILGLEKTGNDPAGSFSKYIHPDDLAAATKAFYAQHDSSMDYRLIRRDGILRYVSSEWKYEFDVNGKAVRVYGVLQDITERKLGEIDRKNLVKDLLTRNTELEQFAYVASHDLQEPLRMITSFMTQLEKKYSDVVDEKGRKYIHFAVDGAKRMRQIILDVLEFSTVGKTEDALEDVDFNKLISEIIALYRKQIAEVKAHITFKNLPVIKSYKTPLRQIFQNLIGNSLKYCEASRAPVISIGCTETKTYFRFSVSDNGIGIAPEYAEKIFVIFQRLHNKDEYSGTGMGLAIVKKIVENLGGKIWVESTEGNGATFYFTIMKT